MMLDRMPTNELSMTHAMMSRMLGVRREGITDAAGKLQKAGIIRYHRGHITVLDHPALKQRVCECYTGVDAVAVPAEASGRPKLRLL